MALNDIERILADLDRETNLRRLRTAVPSGKYIETGGDRYLNMSSNDYLGLGSETTLQREFLQCMQNEERFVMSSSASRLMTGNGPDYDQLESVLGGLWGRAAVVLGSGYAINSALLPALTDKNDAVLADKLVHASIVDGLRLCQCPWARFNHNDMDHLEKLIRKTRADGCTGDIWVATESIFSMDGDRAPLAELMDLKKRHGIRLYLDEAHAFGVMGPDGRGLAAAQGIDHDIDIIVATFGKALASVGGFVVCDAPVRELMVNRMRTLIFSTALPPITLQWSRFLTERLRDFEPRRKHLASLISALSGNSPSATHIIPLMTYDNDAAQRLSDQLKDAGYWVTPIRHPTVPRGKARVRISLSAALDTEDILNFKEICNSILHSGQAPTN